MSELGDAIIEASRAAALPFGRVAASLAYGLAVTSADAGVLWFNSALAGLLHARRLIDDASDPAQVGEAIATLADGELRDAVIRTAEAGAPRTGVLEHLDAAGCVSYWRWSVAPVVTGRDGCELLLRLEDATITDEERVALEEIADRYRAISDSARDIVLLMHEDGTIFHANRSALEAYGLTRERIIGANIRDLRAEPTVAIVAQQMSEAQRHGILFETEHRRADGTVFPVEVSSRGVEIAGRRALLSIVRDITPRREHEVEQARLVEDLERVNRRLDGILRVVSSALNSLDPEALLAEVMATLRRVMDADAALLFRDDGEHFTLLAADGLQAEEYGHRFAVPRDSGFVARVAEAERALYVADVPGSVFCLDEHRRQGIVAMLGTPLRRDGGVFGVLECAWCSPRAVSEADIAMLEVTGDKMMTAVANAQLYERTRRAESFGHVLNEVSALVNSSLDISATLSHALAKAANALECEIAMVGDFEGGMWTPYHAHGTDCRPVAAPESHPSFDRDMGAGVAHVTIGPGSHSHSWLRDSWGLEEAVVVPLRARGEFMGALMVGRAQYRGMDDVAISFLRDFGTVVAFALGNVSQYEAEHRIAETLQEALLIVPDSVSGVCFGDLYRSATVSTRVGGDFYDIFEMSDSRVGVLIGDVSGKGLEAAVLTSLIKDTFRAYAHDGSTPASVVGRANTVLHAAARLPEFASAFFGVLDTRGKTLTYCCAGHPPAAIVSPRGVRFLESRSAVIGAFPDMEYVDEAVPIAPDEALVLYTDGVTEARLGAELFGDGRLERLLEEVGGASVEEIPRRVYERVLEFTGGRLSDDVAIFAIRLA